MHDKLLNVHEVAEWLGVSDPTVRRLVAKGELPQPIRLGRLVRWRAKDIETSFTSKQDPT